MGYRTYIDTGVLIASLHGPASVTLQAISYLNDSLRDYVTSDFVKLELFPQCRFHKNAAEERHYEDFFQRCKIYVPTSPELIELAIAHGSKTGISGLDAIHVACAIAAEAEELITAERVTKVIHRAVGIKVITINP